MKRERYQRRKGDAYLERIAGLALILVVATVASSCSRDPRVDALIQMEPPTEVATSRERIDELKAIIAEYEKIVGEKVHAAVKQASYLKLLAQEYLRNELYGPALETIEEAILIEPRNQVLFELAGVCAAYLAKAQAREDERARYLVMAERFYLASLEIDPNYRDGLYALATLYHFEMGRHLDSIRVLERLLEIRPNHIQALFILARANAALGKIDEAVRAYDQIIEESGDRGVAEQARRNRLLLLGERE
jgi:tetratricopeptide (TPR) repeat protein